MNANHFDVVKTLVVDDSAIFRQGVINFLKMPPLKIKCDEAESGNSAIKLLMAGKYNLVLLDRRMPEMSGLEAARIIRRKFPEIAIIIMTSSFSEDKNEIIEFLEIGINGYLYKEDNTDKIIRAIESIIRGGNYYTGDIEKLIELFKSDKYRLIDDKSLHEVELSYREKQTIVLICKQFTNEKIAEKLNISVATVKTHRLHIMHKINAENVIGIVIYAIKTGLFKP